MNARVYDVGLGRFLSADTIIQDPHDTQAYNRYSYVRNNPLNATDPTGHSWLSKLWDKVSSVVIGVVTAVLAIYTGGFMGGVAGGLLSRANLSDSLSMGLKGAGWGAVGAGVAFGIGEVATTFRASWGGAIGKAALHGFSRAAIAKAQYGTGKGAFGVGFISSLFHPQALGIQNSVGKVVASAIVGGTASVIGGGKFANGAVSRAFITMFNDRAHETVKRTKWDLNQDGKLSLSEAKNWYQTGKGQSIAIDGRTVNFVKRSNTVGYGIGEDYLIHGEVKINPKTGGIFDGDYDFTMHGDHFFDDGYYGFRNAVTVLGHIFNGSGQSYEIEYHYLSQDRWRE